MGCDPAVSTHQAEYISTNNCKWYYSKTTILPVEPTYDIWYWVWCGRDAEATRNRDLLSKYGIFILTLDFWGFEFYV